MLAKVKYLSKEQVGKKFRKEVKRFTKDKESMAKAARTIKVETLANIREGFGVDDKPLPPLKPSTISRREDMQDTNKTGLNYSAGFSNATFSGDLLKSYKVKFLGKGKFTGEFTGIHKKYKGFDGKPVGKTVANSAIASGLSARGWEFYGVTKKARERLLENLRRFIRRRK